MINVIFAIARKELALFFGSPIGYLFLLAYLGMTLFVFFWVEAFFARNIADVRPMFEWLPISLVFLSAALTMRMWSEERRSGTLEFVVTVPASAGQFVLGKFLACWVLLGVALILTLPVPVTVAVLGDLDWGPVFAGYLAAMLLGGAYLSVGLFMSSKTDNQIVALILGSFVSGLFYLIGSPFVAELFTNEVGSLLRSLGTASRFESITRGVLDLRDLWYYVSIVGVFLALNVYALERYGWAKDGSAERHRRWRVVTGLLVVNFVVVNVWLSSVSVLRWDVTEGQQFSISKSTREYLSQLREPLLIRGYFSAKTHPLLAPLVPQIRDLLTEYKIVGGSRLRLELVDPVEAPELEEEANTKYGIRPVPFQVADRYQASLVSSYFDVLVQYGDEYEVLGFRDLIEVKVRGESDLDVQLRNPEYDITRSIKKVLYGFQGGDSIFENITEPVTFIGYLSAEDRLPLALVEFKKALVTVLDELVTSSKGKFKTTILDPDAGDGALADEIAERFGFSPMAASLFDPNTFYFYLTLAGSETVVQVPIPDVLEASALKRRLEDGLKRFASGLLKTVALHAPKPPNPYLEQQMPPTGYQYGDLLNFLSTDFDVETATLDSGRLGAAADVLFVVDSGDLDNKALFAIDQFLMRGGTLAIATGAFDVTLNDQSLLAIPKVTRLEEWLLHHGVTIDKTLVMDRQNASFPVPVTRQVGGFSFKELVMLDYPYFVDVRDEGLNQESLITSGLPQVTMTWASPVDVDSDANAERSVSTLLQSSQASWRSGSTEIMPKVDNSGLTSFSPDGQFGASPLAVMIEGKFDSFFDESPLLNEPANDDVDTAIEPPEKKEGGDESDDMGDLTGLISRSSESSRLVVFGSESFVADQTIRMIGSAEGTLYANTVQLVANLVDWAVEDVSLLSIRSRGQFNRTLAPMPENEQRVWEYLNYVVAVIGVGVVFGFSLKLKDRRRRRHALWLKKGSHDAEGVSV